MKDLDFDELDRAVNSLMTNVPKIPEPHKKDDTVQTLTITPTINQDAAPSFNTLDSTLNQINKTESPVSGTASLEQSSSSVLEKRPSVAAVDSVRPGMSPPVAVRRGRFMDVVRPTSTGKKPDAFLSGSRLGVSIMPTGPSMKDVVPAVQSASSPVGVAPAAPQEVPSPASSDWPDPLDLVKKTDTPELLEESEDVQGEELLASGPIETPKPVVEATPVPLTSPFLADAKVEKRPLGAPAVDDVVVVAKEQTNDDEESVGVQTNPANMSRPALPEELSTDMTALESGADTVSMPSVNSPSTPSPVLTSETPKAAVEDIPTEVTSPIVTRSTLTTPEPDTKSTSPASVSIPQQYHEEPSTGDKENGSIYDTDTYHKPLAHPVKKSSGWMWVLWIVVILVLGAGGGAMLYFLHVF